MGMAKAKVSRVRTHRRRFRVLVDGPNQGHSYYNRQLRVLITIFSAHHRMPWT